MHTHVIRPFYMYYMHIQCMQSLLVTGRAGGGCQSPALQQTMMMYNECFCVYIFYCYAFKLWAGVNQATEQRARCLQT